MRMEWRYPHDNQHCHSNSVLFFSLFFFFFSFPVIWKHLSYQTPRSLLFRMHEIKHGIPTRNLCPTNFRLGSSTTKQPRHRNSMWIKHILWILPKCLKRQTSGENPNPNKWEDHSDRTKKQTEEMPKLMQEASSNQISKWIPKVQHGFKNRTARDAGFLWYNPKESKWKNKKELKYPKNAQ